MRPPSLWVRGYDLLPSCAKGTPTFFFDLALRLCRPRCPDALLALCLADLNHPAEPGRWVDPGRETEWALFEPGPF